MDSRFREHYSPMRHLREFPGSHPYRMPCCTLGQQLHFHFISRSITLVKIHNTPTTTMTTTHTHTFFFGLFPQCQEDHEMSRCDKYVSKYSGSFAALFGRSMLPLFFKTSKQSPEQWNQKTKWLQVIMRSWHSQVHPIYR